MTVCSQDGSSLPSPRSTESSDIRRNRRLPQPEMDDLRIDGATLRGTRTGERGSLGHGAASPRRRGSFERMNGHKAHPSRQWNRYQILGPFVCKRLVPVRFSVSGCRPTSVVEAGKDLRPRPRNARLLQHLSLHACETVGARRSEYLCAVGTVYLSQCRLPLLAVSLRKGGK